MFCEEKILSSWQNDQIFRGLGAPEDFLFQARADNFSPVQDGMKSKGDKKITNWERYIFHPWLSLFLLTVKIRFPFLDLCIFEWWIEDILIFSGLFSFFKDRPEISSINIMTVEIGTYKTMIYFLITLIYSQGRTVNSI